MFCKFCAGKLTEGNAICPLCGGDNGSSISEEKTKRDDYIAQALQDDPLKPTVKAEDFFNEASNEPPEDAVPPSDDAVQGSEPYRGVPYTCADCPEGAGVNAPQGEYIDSGANRPGTNTITKKKKWILISAVTAALVGLLILVLYIFRAELLMMMAPREYAAYCLANTAARLKDDTNELADSLLGFDIELDDDVIIDNKLSLPGADVPYESMELSYVPSQNGAYASLKGVCVYDERVDMDVLWNDRIIGMYVPAVSDEDYYAISSKNFGSQLSSTTLPLSDDVKNDPGLLDKDISFSTVTGQDEPPEDLDELGDAITEKTLEFVQKSRVESKDKTKATIDGKEKSLHTLSLSFKGSDVKEYLLSCCLMASTDEAFVKRYGLQKTEDFEKWIKDTSYAKTIYVDLKLYRDHVVAISVNDSSDSMRFDLSFGSTEHLADGFRLAYGTAESAFEMITEGYIVPRDGKVDYRISINNDDKFTLLDISLDFNKSKASLVVDFPSTEKLSMEGSVSNNKGLSLDVAGKECSIALSVKEGGSLRELKGEEYMLLEKNTASVVWHFGLSVIKSKEARGIVVGIAKDYFEGIDLENTENNKNSIGSLFGF